MRVPSLLWSRQIQHHRVFTRTLAALLFSWIALPHLAHGYQAFELGRFYAPQDWEYTRGIRDLDSWLSWRFEDIDSVIDFCRKGERKTLTIIDPYTLEYHYLGLSRAFFTTCEVRYAYAENLSLAKHDYIFSITSCAQSFPQPALWHREIEYYWLNQSIVCQANMIMPYLYQYE